MDVELRRCEKISRALAVDMFAVRRVRHDPMRRTLQMTIRQFVLCKQLNGFDV